MHRGRLICTEGGDGSGKTTTLRLVKKWAFTQAKYHVIFTKEPAGTQMGQQIRRILLNPNYHLTKIQQAYLFAVARRDHIKRVIAPALASGDIVICDRYLLSSMAYQGKYVREHSLLSLLTNSKAYRDLNHVIAINKPMITYHGHVYYPDLNVYFDLDPKIEISRLNKRSNKHDKFDAAVDHINVLKQLRKNYYIALKECPSESLFINAENNPKVRAQEMIDGIEDIAHQSSMINP